MIFSGPKSYYDEYVRKSGTQRTLTDPSSLLTDRGAYVNFLEVQLERVSAACLGVQAYDQRFNDMQNLIVALEQRCDTTNKLLGLVQQSVEESNADYVGRYEKLLSTVKANETTSLTAMQAVSDRVASCEQSLASMSGLRAYVEQLEKKLTFNEELLEGVVRKADEDRNSMEIKTADALLKVNELYSKIDTLSAQASRSQFDFDDYKSRQNTSMIALENKINDSIAREREEVSSKMKSVSVTIEMESEKLRREIEKCNADIDITMQQQRAEIAATLREHESMRIQDDEILRYISTEMQTMSETFKGEFDKIRKESKSVDGSTLKLHDDLKRLEETVTGHVDMIEKLQNKATEGEGQVTEKMQIEDRNISVSSGMDGSLLAQKIAEYNKQFLNELLKQGVISGQKEVNLMIDNPQVAQIDPQSGSMTASANHSSASVVPSSVIDAKSSSFAPNVVPLSPKASMPASRSQSPNALLHKGMTVSSQRTSDDYFEEIEEVPAEAAEFSRRRRLANPESSLETKLTNETQRNENINNSSSDGVGRIDYDGGNMLVEDEEDEMPSPAPFNVKRESITRQQQNQQARYVQESIDNSIQQAFGKFMNMYKEDQEQMNEKLETILELQVDTITDNGVQSPERSNRRTFDNVSEGKEINSQEGCDAGVDSEDISVRSQSSKASFQNSLDEMFPLQAKLKKQREVAGPGVYRSPYTGATVSLENKKVGKNNGNTDNQQLRSKSANKSITSSDFVGSSRDNNSDSSSTSSDFFETVFHKHKSKIADFMRDTALSSSRIHNVKPLSIQQPWLPTKHNLNEKVTSEKLKILSKQPTRMALMRGSGRSVSAQSTRTRNNYGGDSYQFRSGDTITSTIINSNDKLSSSIDTERLMKNDDAIREDVFMALRNARALDRSRSPKLDNLRGSAAIVKRSSALRNSAQW